VNGEQLRAHLIEVLRRAEGPTTPTAARAAHTGHRDDHGPAVVAELVYRALLILQRRGVVRRAHGRGHHAHWELTHGYRRQLQDSP
jgi:Fe2+ or Zn2+ uptake regulation protein